MNADALHTAARHIVARNVGDNVALAAVAWEQEARHLTLRFSFTRPPSEGDLEDQELVMTELVAEFPDIATCECSSTALNDTVPRDDVTVYERRIALL